jgi:hypothetical protein
MDSLINGAQQNIESLGRKIQSKLAQGTATGTTIPRDEIFKGVADTFNADGAALDHEQVSSIVSSLAPQVKGLLAKDTLTLSEANQLRSALDRTLGDRAFLKSQLPFQQRRAEGLLRQSAQYGQRKGSGRAPQFARSSPKKSDFATFSAKRTFRNPAKTSLRGETS